jgi:hypothetical protein
MFSLTRLQANSEMPPGYYLIKKSWYPRYALEGTDYRILTGELVSEVLRVSRPLEDIWKDALEDTDARA